MTTRLPKRITLVWGCERLEIEDPSWVAKIVQEMSRDGGPSDDARIELSWPRSRRLESIHASLAAAGFHSGSEEDEDQVQMGYQAPEPQDGVAVEALRVFLGLELPVALNFTSWGRSKHRMSAVHTAFMPSWRSRHDELELQWIFSGYQLYASHHIGQAHLHPYSTATPDYLERRLLSGQWVRWGFDGASTPPPGRYWSSNRRTYILAPSGIQRIGQSDSDLVPIDDGMAPSLEST